jgi:hypothetical protein
MRNSSCSRHVWDPQLPLSVVMSFARFARRRQSEPSPFAFLASRRRATQAPAITVPRWPAAVRTVAASA